MNYLQHLLDSKGSGSMLLRRALMIGRRFGLSRTKSRNALQRFLEISSKHGCTPTLFITGDLLDYHGGLLRMITQDGVHVGLHGNHHIDHAQMSGKVQTHEIAKGLEKFKACDIPVSGFRGPFLRFNHATAKAVVENNMSWVSHSVMLLDHDSRSAPMAAYTGIRQLLQDFYVQELHQATPCLPSRGTHCLEIPVSLPDDELLVDRLGIQDLDEMTAIWSDMLRVTREEGELCTLLFHPERIPLTAKPLDAVLEKATGYKDIWTASLDDIAQWWQERATFSFEINLVSPQALAQSAPGRASGVYAVIPHCTDRASVVLQHPKGKVEFVKARKNESFAVQTQLRPVIRVLPGSPEEDAHFLANEGFILDYGADPSSCAFTLDTRRKRTKRELLEALKHARGPLLRFARWPKGFRSALSITADVDAITLWDFIRRARHFFNCRGRSLTRTNRNKKERPITKTRKYENTKD